MTKRMLIDATHEEETRVAVIHDDRLEEFDYESKFRKPLKGSIFLAKVTRVEPSLQAAFVHFGGNRHGFLPFSEIHPDYFRIPIADREALMAEQDALLEEAEKAEEEIEEEEPENDSENLDETDNEEDNVDGNVKDSDGEDGGNADDNDRRGRRHSGRGRRGGKGRQNRSRGGEKYSGGPEEAERRFRFNLRRKYKIQEVIKRGQIMLIQVSKEERGNKGAAVGSYLSLPGRYCVLMPNSPRAGGVSRKIANNKDRNRMRDIMKDLEVPKGMSVILRTAGMSRTKTEIKRDLDYLIKLWNNIRELTLESSAPSLVYEEADLIKRSVRDIYTRDIEEVYVAGKEGFKNAKNFMKMMIPSHVKKVIEYTDAETPLFNKYKVERQIAEIGEVQVTLPSGGYLVINPTEALISIDVNSGRSTKERHIEETALKTNLEAATEVARQLRLRDLGGLVVIDFIDMEDRRNNGKVERRMRDSMSGDRARTQTGRISSFGLMELSRQRLNPSLNEAQFESCNNCEGTGRVRTADATSIMVLRAIEDEGIKARAAQVIVHVSNDVALYILNNKRGNLTTLEARYGFQILIRVDDSVGASSFRVEVSKPSGASDSGDQPEEQTDKNSDSDDNRSGGRRRGRRGGRRRNTRADQNPASSSEGAPSNEVKSDESPKKEEAPRNKSSVEKVEDVIEEKPEASEKPKKAPARGRKPATKKVEEAPKDKAETSEKPKKAPARKAAVKKTEEKTEDKPAAKEKKTPKKKDSPSNDDKPSVASQHEKINEVSGEKKSGWWNRIKGE